MLRWVVLGAIAALLVLAAWAYLRATKRGPDHAWSDRQDDVMTQVRKTWPWR
jgi:hypothetical protein